MTASTATWPVRRPAGHLRSWEVALFALVLALSGLVAVTLLFSGTGTYEDIARDSGRTSSRITLRSGAGTTFPVVDLAYLSAFHERWVAYVTGRRPDPPRTIAVQFFTGDEYSHMADVRTLFIAAQLAAVAAAAVLIWLALRARRRGALAHLVRAGALSALAAVAVVAVLAAVAFDAAFLLFHQVFFPQGNFLFAPDSNLLALYPESYFYGVTLRIGASFVTLAGLLAALSHAALRRRSASA